ncbi:uncharacterized protein LOC128203403 [Mya arenaria]|uniref:uncharacterized protein LOC128203403 n=1 Tax=Mya arenaria TaxID=6604 RepID=UPI0022E24CDB|nr:uncharacterized protein LOC128203403 [Mya arenaria]XP_052760769.1 uncharacterized protein LOC128203403 [Mya arenaria]XP_052760770.1 uncharacterized protein LOC128203403 [Mya arenaria]
MEECHKDILLIQRVNLVDNMNMRGGLLSQLIARKVLDPRMVREIKTGRTLDQQAEELLDILPQCGSKAFKLFCDALVADKQGELVSLFLKSETENNETSENNSDRKSSPACVQETETGETKESVSLTHSASRESLPTASYVQPVTIREEYQQESYRRSIEPHGAILVEPNLDQGHGIMQRRPSDDQDFQQEARYFYENKFLDPSKVSKSVYSVYNSGGMMCSQNDKERLFRPEYGYGSHSKHKVPGLYEEPGIKYDMIAKDSSPANMINHGKHELTRSIAHSPNVFMHSPQKSGLPSNVANVNTKFHENSEYSNRFAPLKSRNHLGDDRSQFSQESNGNPQVRVLTDRNYESEVRNNQKRSRNRFDDEHFMEKDVQHFEGPYPAMTPKAYQREYTELPERFVEVNSDADNRQDRKIVTLRRHVERVLPVSRHPDLQTKEYPEMGDNYVPHRLARNDSVDTMHKRPSSEQLETNYSKRFREDVDSVPNQDVPDRQVNQTAVERLVHSDLQNSKDIVRIPTPQKTKPSPIPIISESPRVTSQPKFYIQGDLEHEKGQRSSLLGAMDDPEIDLTDGPITVHVELCARQFYLNHYKKAYQMARIPRGKALILNVNQVVGKTERRGTDIDRDNLHHLLCQLHFDVTVINDEDGLTALEMVKKLQDFSQDPGHALGDCCVVCILSHGEEGYIFGADGKKFELDAVFSLFDNTCCPDLRGKPKMFIIQACRGGALDRGVQYYPDEHDGADARVRQVPSMSDMLICYPTQEGYYAWRNRDRGSWYVEALVQVFMKYAHCEDVCAMLNRVNLLVSKKVSHCPNADMDRMSQMSEYKSTLRMPHLFFFPGIGTA